MLWVDCEEVVQSTWDANVNDGHGLEIIKQKIQVCRENLRTWRLSKTRPNTEEIK